MKTILLSMIAAAALRGQSAAVDQGKQLFESKACFQCHGWRGQGGLAGARLAQTKMTLVAFRAFVRNPPPGGMPGYRPTVLSDVELENIFAYIQSFPPPEPASNIPLLREGAR